MVNSFDSFRFVRNDNDNMIFRDGDLVFDESDLRVKVFKDKGFISIMPNWDDTFGSSVISGKTISLFMESYFRIKKLLEEDDRDIQ